ncbi:TonB-dependent receptor domain-containing protein [Paenirhodobacter sp.]|uniref:TonB-dependent receptor domain-containing protein n=1 Tax=Paenirhodobacter sp. TaxID=1965326 RepID=UPI003B3C223D
MRYPPLRALLCTTAIFGMPLTALAQEETVLDTIVVTAAGIEQTVREAPASVTVVTAEELEKGSFTNLTDALKETQGVAVTGVAGEEDIYIRGLPGQYTLILVDGKRQSTRDARTNGNAGFEQSFIPPISAIERIEVVRGPMSSLYGSDAMGGVINVITKKVSDVWSGEVRVDTSIPTDDEYDSSRNQVSAFISGPLIENKLGMQAWVRYLDRGERKDRPDLTDGRDAQTQREAGAKFVWTPTDRQTVELQLGTNEIKTDSENSDNESKHTRKNIGLTHKGDWSFGSSEVSLSREVGERTSFAAGAENPRSPEVTNTVLDFKLNSPVAGGQHNLVYGGQIIKTELEDQNPGLGDGLDHTYSNRQWALFLEDEFAITNTFRLTGGLRYNHHSEYDGHWTPRLYGVWDAAPNLTVKGGYSAGFRAPDIRTTTRGYAYTTGGAGCASRDATLIENRCGVILGDPNLKPEKTKNYELSVFYDAGDWNASATVFHTKFDDKLTQLITNEEWTDGPKYRSSFDGKDYYRRVYYNKNVDKAEISGVELTGQWHATDRLSLRGSYTYTKSEQKSGEYKGAPLARTPEHMASLRADFADVMENMSLWGAVNYHGEEKAAGLRIGNQGTPVNFGNGVTGYKYDPYTTVDVGMNYQVNESAQIGVAVYNLFDEEPSYNELEDDHRQPDGLARADHPVLSMTPGVRPRPIGRAV